MSGSKCKISSEDDSRAFLGKKMTASEALAKVADEEARQILTGSVVKAKAWDALRGVVKISTDWRIITNDPDAIKSTINGQDAYFTIAFWPKDFKKMLKVEPYEIWVDAGTQRAVSEGLMTREGK